MTARLPELTVASVYVPNGGKDFEAKLRFLGDLEAFAASHARDGVAARDLRRPERGAHRCRHPPEGTQAQQHRRAARRARAVRAACIVARPGRRAAGRSTRTPTDLFTWWPPWRNLRQRNIGWRIDYVLASTALHARTASCVVEREVGTSDHAPGHVDLRLERTPCPPGAHDALRPPARLRLPRRHGAACRDTASPSMSATPPTTPPAAATVVRDPHSAARPEEARVTHVALDLAADFTAKTLAGTATLTLGADRIGADARARHRRPDDRQGHRRRRPHAEPRARRQGRRSSASRSPITLPPDVTKVVVEYRTSPQAAALQWLSPAQTAGRKQPYLFSQGQAILTRSWIPTQDSPAIRQTYEARITVPAPLRAVMSAERLTPDGVPLPDGRRRFEFRLTHAGPALPDRARRRRPRGPADRRADGGRRRAVGGRSRGRASSSISRRWSRPPRRSTGRIAGAATTCWCCRRRSRSAAWRTRCSRSRRRRSSPAIDR